MTGSLALLCVALAAADAPVDSPRDRPQALAHVESAVQREDASVSGLPRLPQLDRGVFLDLPVTARLSTAGVLLAQRASPPPRSAEGPRASAPESSATVTYRVGVEDAPASAGASFLASGLTSFTGVASLIGLLASPPSDLPLGSLNWRGRLGASLLLMSFGPSMGDLLNHDTSSFLVGALGRTAIAGLSWGAIELVFAVGQSSPATAALLSVGTVLFVAVGALVWTGWCTVDLIRSLFAPERWAERTNAQLRSRAPIAEVRQTGGLRYVH